MREFNMTVTIDGDELRIRTENIGLNSFEVLGALEAKKNDILRQMNHPAEFKRTLIKDGKEFRIDEEV